MQHQDLYCVEPRLVPYHTQPVESIALTIADIAGYVLSCSARGGPPVRLSVSLEVYPNVVSCLCRTGTTCRRGAWN